MTVAAVVAAAGRGDRLGVAHDGSKALLELGGRTLLDLAVGNLVAAGMDHLVVVHPPGQRGAFATAVAAHGRIEMVEGGPTRSDSVRRGARAVLSDHDVVAIHDAARALTPPDVIRAAVAVVADDVIAAAPGMPIRDTLKRADGTGCVQGTLDRTGVWAVHTPQVIRADVLRATLEWAGIRDASDDIGLVEAAREAGVVSGEIRMVAGDPRDIKITYPADIEVARLLLEADPTQVASDGHAPGRSA